MAATVDKFGVEGLLLTVFLSGFMLIVMGFLRLGSLIRHIPHAVTLGFTAGIAITILASQLKELGGLRVSGDEPSHVLPKLIALWSVLPTVNPSAVAVGIGSAILIFSLKRWRPHWPGMLIAVVGASCVSSFLQMPIETVGSHFGGIPRGLPLPQLPPMDVLLLLAVLPPAPTFTLLGGVESLLSAKVADGMTGRKHRYNMELVAQGIANIASAMFGGISVTGTIARTATNIRAGARTPFSGIFHAGFLLVFVLIAAPLASYIPLAALAGVLVVVAWNMVERHEFVRLLQNWSTAAVLLVTFGLTLVQDLTFGIVGGCLLSTGIAIGRRVFRANAEN